VYRDQLRRKTGLNYALEMAVPKPLADRTMFHLVLGCGHRAAVELFREVEARVIGREAPAILEGARRARDRKDGQTSLEFDSAPRMQKR